MNTDTHKFSASPHWRHTATSWSSPTERGRSHTSRLDSRLNVQRVHTPTRVSDSRRTTNEQTARRAATIDL